MCDICILLWPGQGTLPGLGLALVPAPHHPSPALGELSSPRPRFHPGDGRRSRPVNLFLHGDNLEPEAPQSVEEALELALVEGLGLEAGPTFARIDRHPRKRCREAVAESPANDDRVPRWLHVASLGSGYGVAVILDSIWVTRHHPGARPPWVMSTGDRSDQLELAGARDGGFAL
jgi:hypothetical protein